LKVNRGLKAKPQPQEARGCLAGASSVQFLIFFFTEYSIFRRFSAEFLTKSVKTFEICLFFRAKFLNAVVEGLDPFPKSGGPGKAFKHPSPMMLLTYKLSTLLPLDFIWSVATL